MKYSSANLALVRRLSVESLPPLGVTGRGLHGDDVEWREEELLVLANVLRLFGIVVMRRVLLQLLVGLRDNCVETLEKDEVLGRGDATLGALREELAEILDDEILAEILRQQEGFGGEKPALCIAGRRSSSGSSEQWRSWQHHARVKAAGQRGESTTTTLVWS